MKHSRQRLIYFLALAALLAMFAGCKGESPTAPPATGTGGTGGAGNPPGGGITPPVGATLTLTVSNATPLIDSVSIITATVSLNGQPVVNGTAVEFITNLGIFTDTQDVRTIRTTTNGVTTATLTSPDPGVATISATVNNVTRTIQVTFNESPVTPTQPSTAPTISSVSPNTGSPTGGTLITINGTNFRSPVRVIVDAGPAGSKEAFVQSNTTTQIVAITPSINLTQTQTQPAAITVIVDAGSPTEQRVTRTAIFTYVTTNLTPIYRALSPTSGPIDGGTRITIVGDAFDSAGGVQVFFGAAQAQIISVNFSQIIVMSPTARDTAPNGSGAVTGPVDIRIKNIASGKEVTTAGAFRYTPKSQITLISPNQGPFTGGTRFTIDGEGFNEPLSITLAGIAAQVIKVTGTQLIGISAGVAVAGCSDVTGPVIVTNGDNGDQAEGPEWIYRVVRPAIVSVVSPVGGSIPGGTARITVVNAVDPSRILIGGKGAFISGQTVNADGTITYDIQIPSTLELETVTCAGVTATARIPTSFDVQYTSLPSGCTDILTDGITVSPPAGPLFTLVGTMVPFVGRIVPPTPPAVTPTVTVTPESQTITIVNTGFNPTGTTPLTVTSITQTSTNGTGCAAFSITTNPIPPQSLDVCETLGISVSYNAPTVATAVPDQCTLTIVTNAGTKTLSLSGTSR